MHRSPPPFFNQGPSAHVRLAFFALLAVLLLTLDARGGILSALRQGVGTVLHPLQRVLLWPRDLSTITSEHLAGTQRLRDENADLRRIEVSNARALLQAEHLAAENLRLRELLGARERPSLASTVAEVLYETRDPYTRRVVIDRGQQEGLLAGQPVIDAAGVVGQVTRTLPSSAEVTLLTDRNATIPVEVQRTRQRLIAFGGGNDGLLELRFLSAGSDLVAGDRLITSGLDGIFPPGLPVAEVLTPETLSPGKTRVLARPLGGVEQTRMVLVLKVDAAALPPPAPPPEASTEGRRRRSARD